MSYDPYDGEYYENEYDLDEPDEYDGPNQWDQHEYVDECDDDDSEYGDALSYEVYERIFGGSGSFTDPEDYSHARAEWDAYCMRILGHYVDPDSINH